MKNFRVTKETKFTDLKKQYDYNDSDIDSLLEKSKNMTQFVDSLLFRSRSLIDIVEAVERAKETKYKDNKDFKTVARIQSHINYRIKHDKVKVVKNKKTNKVRYINVN